MQSCHRRMVGDVKFQSAQPQSVAFRNLTSLSRDFRLLFMSEFASEPKSGRGDSVGLGETIARICGHSTRVGDDAISLIRGAVRKALLGATSIVGEYPGTSARRDDLAVTYLENYWRRRLPGRDENQAVDGASLPFQYLEDPWSCYASSEMPDLAGSSAARSGSSAPLSLSAIIASSSAIAVTLLDYPICSDGADWRAEVALLPSIVHYIWVYIEGYIAEFIGRYLEHYTWNQSVPRLRHGHEDSKQRGPSRRGIGRVFDDDEDRCNCPGGRCPPGQGCRSPK
ncbi:hypothetical protein ANO14919_126750 [Xylariales sp. No.14919]|nr:hypothetical protein ANO14919_126750 [Xylariales sp. No.14919]